MASEVLGVRFQELLQRPLSESAAMSATGRLRDVGPPAVFRTFAERAVF
jgi:hypothetical protein